MPSVSSCRKLGNIINNYLLHWVERIKWVDMGRSLITECYLLTECYGNICCYDHSLPGPVLYDRKYCSEWNRESACSYEAYHLQKERDFFSRKGLIQSCLKPNLCPWTSQFPEAWNSFSNFFFFNFGCAESKLQHASLAALQYEGSQSPDQGSNPSSCIGRLILKHWITREVPWSSFSFPIS